ncbi:MAG: hypothetical protein ACYTGW_02975 [Planctomycetota bacterium]|jgi:hypothetical protein
MLLAAKLVLLLSAVSGAVFGWSLVVHAVATAAFLVLVHGVVQGDHRPSFREALGIALALRVLVLPLEPALSDDIHRYVHEGNMVLQGENPYVVAPAQVAPELRLPGWDRINHPDLPAAYPPAVQYGLALAVWIHPAPLTMKLLFGALDLLTFVALWFWLPRLGLCRTRAVVYGYCPLVVLEFAGEGHSDSMAALFLVLALWAFTTSRPLWSSAGLAVATAAKLLPAVFLPFVCRRKPAALVPFVAVLGLLCAWFIAPGMFAGTAEYSSEWTGNASVFAVLHWGCRHLLDWIHITFDTKLWNLVYYPHNVAKAPIVLLGLVVLFHCWRHRWPLHQVVATFMVFFVACTPTLHPWYLVLLVPFLCIYPNWGWLVFTATVFLAHEQVPLWLRIVEYLPFYLGFLFVRSQAPVRSESLHM